MLRQPVKDGVGLDAPVGFPCDLCGEYGDIGLHHRDRGEHRVVR